jgi:hypothetical protein
MYCHYQNQIENPVSVKEFIEELRSCPDNKEAA